MNQPKLSHLVVLSAAGRGVDGGPMEICRQWRCPEHATFAAFRTLEDRKLIAVSRSDSGRFVRRTEITPRGRQLLDEWLEKLRIPE
jgi:DNA-binding MarR family transcriptional regulator